MKTLAGMLRIQETMRTGQILYCEALSMGNDLTLAVYGGEKPHVGTVVLTEPRSSLSGKGCSS